MDKLNSRKCTFTLEKIQKAKRMLEAYVVVPHTTKSLAQLLGVMTSIEPAVPLLLLLVRPLYDDLKDALTDGREGDPIGDNVPIPRHGGLDEFKYDVGYERKIFGFKQSLIGSR